MLPDRLPPQAIDAEMAVLGAALISKTAAEGLLELWREDFYLESHRKVYDVMTSLVRAERPADTLTVTETLRQREQLEAVGGVGVILGLSEGVASAAHANYYRRLVREASVLRRIIQECADITAECFEQPEDLEGFAAAVERRIQAITSMGVPAELQTLQPHTAALSRRLADALTGQVPPPGTPTGFHSLADAFDGKGVRFREGHLWVVGGRPSMGKTSLCLQFLLHLARGGYPVLMVSLEMSEEQLVERLATLGIPADVDGALRGRIDDHLFDHLSGNLARLGDLPFYVDTQAQSAAAVRAHVHEIQRLQGCPPSLVVVDYLQRMGGGRGNNRNEELDYLCREFKTLARDKRTTVILVSQLSRNVEQREDKRPRKADLRESGGIEAEADVILFPFRPDYYRRDADQESEPPTGLERAEFIVEKNRMGKTGTVYTTWSTHFGGFELVDPYHTDNQASPYDGRLGLDADGYGRGPGFGDD